MIMADVVNRDCLNQFHLIDQDQGNGANEYSKSYVEGVYTSAEASSCSRFEVVRTHDLLTGARPLFNVCGASIGSLAPSLKVPEGSMTALSRLVSNRRRRAPFEAPTSVRSWGSVPLYQPHLCAPARSCIKTWLQGRRRCRLAMTADCRRRPCGTATLRPTVRDRT